MGRARGRKRSSDRSESAISGPEARLGAARISKLGIGSRDPDRSESANSGPESRLGSARICETLKILRAAGRFSRRPPQNFQRLRAFIPPATRFSAAWRGRHPKNVEIFACSRSIFPPAATKKCTSPISRSVSGPKSQASWLIVMKQNAAMLAGGRFVPFLFVIMKQNAIKFGADAFCTFLLSAGPGQMALIRGS